MPNVKPRLSRQERTLNFLVAEESSFPQDALFISAQALRNAWQKFGYRNLLSETMAQFHRALEDAILSLGHIRVVSLFQQTIQSEPAWRNWLVTTGEIF
jgi:hypothetical protein